MPPPKSPLLPPDEEFRHQKHAVMEHRILVLERDFTRFTDELNETLESIREEIRCLQDRPPAWVAVAFSIAGTIIGALATVMVQIMLK